MPHINGIEVPAPAMEPPENGTEYWTLGLGRWIWWGTTHDFSCYKEGIWASEQEVWKVRSAIRKALGIGEFTLSSIIENRMAEKKAFGVTE